MKDAYNELSGEAKANLLGIAMACATAILLAVVFCAYSSFSTWLYMHNGYEYRNVGFRRWEWIRPEDRDIAEVERQP